MADFWLFNRRGGLENTDGFANICHVNTSQNARGTDYFNFSEIFQELILYFAKVCDVNTS